MSQGDVTAMNIMNAAYYETDATLTYEQLFSKYALVYDRAGMSLSGFNYIGNKKSVLTPLYNLQQGTNSSYMLTLYSPETYNTRIELGYIQYDNSNTVYTISVHTPDLQTYYYTCTYNGYETYSSGLSWVKTLVLNTLNQRVFVEWHWAPSYYYSVNYIPSYYTVQDVIEEISPYITNIASLLGITWSPLPKNCGISVEDNNPICNQVVTSISATNPVQNVKVGENIITTVTANMLDGSTKTIICTSNYNPTQMGTQAVTLTYTGLIGNAKTSGTITCTVNVTVNPNTLPSSLSVIPSSTTVYNGVEPSYSVTVYYDNGTSKGLTPAQYSKTGWSIGPGTKTVNFSYPRESGRGWHCSSGRNHRNAPSECFLRVCGRNGW